MTGPTTWVLMAWYGDESWHPLCTFHEHPTFMQRVRAWIEYADHLPWDCDRDQRRYQVDTYGWRQSLQAEPVPAVTQ